MNAVQEKKVDYRLERLTYSQLRLLEELFGRNGRELGESELARLVDVDDVSRNIDQLRQWLNLLHNDGVSVGAIEETAAGYRFHPDDPHPGLSELLSRIVQD